MPRVPWPAPCTHAPPPPIQAPAPELADGLTEGEAVANVVKAVMGAGVFSLPWAVAQGGLLFVPLFILAAALLALYTLRILVDAKRALVALAPGQAGLEVSAAVSSYTGLVEASLGRVWGRAAEVMNLACCFGICSAYLVVVASTLASVVPHGSLGAASPAALQNSLVWAITPPMVGLAWLRSMAGVSLMAMLGNASVVLGMGFVAWFSTTQPWRAAALPLWAPHTFGSYFGSVAFLFFIHFTMPAIEAAMAQPARFMAVATQGFGICAAVGCAFGALGAAAFGPGVSSVVITQLGSTSLATAVKLLLCVNLLFTFPIVCRSAFLIIETLFERAGVALSTLQTRALRAAFVVLASTVATSVPSFGALLNLVGGVSLSLISLVFPPCILLLARTPQGQALLHRSALERAWAALITALGLAILVYTVATGLA